MAWDAPTKNTDGSPLESLAGYYIYYGDSPAALTHVIQIREPASRGYVVRHLSPGTHYFSVSAYTASGAQSGLCVPLSRVITRPR